MNVKIEEKAPQAKLMPEAIVNIYEGVNSMSRIFRKTCNGTERAVDNADRLLSLAASRQVKLLEAQLAEA